MEDDQATGEASRPRKEKNPARQTKGTVPYISSVFLWVNSDHLDQDPADQNQCGSGSTISHF
jgi:hypothetical protein